MTSSIITSLFLWTTAIFSIGSSPKDLGEASNSSLSVLNREANIVSEDSRFEGHVANVISQIKKETGATIPFLITGVVAPLEKIHSFKLGKQTYLSALQAIADYFSYSLTLDMDSSRLLFLKSDFINPPVKKTVWIPEKLAKHLDLEFPLAKAPLQRELVNLGLRLSVDNAFGDKAVIVGSARQITAFEYTVARAGEQLATRFLRGEETHK